MITPTGRGPSMRNSRYVKTGLTKEEQAKVAAFIKDNEMRWKVLFSLNVWRPVK